MVRSLNKSTESRKCWLCWLSGNSGIRGTLATIAFVWSYSVGQRHFGERTRRKLLVANNLRQTGCSWLPWLHIKAQVLTRKWVMSILDRKVALSN